MSRAGEYNEVVSEINTFLAAAVFVKPIISEKNRVANLAFSAPKNDLPAGILQETEKPKAKVDNDGDLVLPRKTDNEDLEELHVLIEYENCTTLDKVGLQVWRGAFLLADFLIHYCKEYLKGKRILELGSGTGLTAIVAAIFADHVTATDINDASILKLLEVNAHKHNKQLLKSDFDVKTLDFLNLDWDADLTEKVANADVILAADVVYSVKITTAFVQTLKKLATCGEKSKHIFIAMEKRYVFTVEDLDSLAHMYAHFLDELDKILQLSPGCLPRPFQGDNGKTFNLSVQFVPIEFPQYFSYERTRHLVLLHLISKV